MSGREKSRVRRVIIVLAILLAISLVSLAGIRIYRHFGGAKPVSGTAPDNIITPEGKTPGQGYPETGNVSAAFMSYFGRTGGSLMAALPVAAASGTDTDDAGVTLSLYDRQPADNTPFGVQNMFPGDSETKYYSVRVSHKGNVTLRFHADIRSGSEKLAEVLRCRVALPDSGEVLYDGLMRDMPESLAHALSAQGSGTSEVRYEITAGLSTDTGSEYMNKTLTADFRWWVEEAGQLEPPETGDGSGLILWGFAAAVSLCLLILLLILILIKRKKEDAANER